MPRTRAKRVQAVTITMSTGEPPSVEFDRRGAGNWRTYTPSEAALRLLERAAYHFPHLKDFSVWMMDDHVYISVVFDYDC